MTGVANIAPLTSSDFAAWFAPEDAELPGDAAAILGKLLLLLDEREREVLTLRHGLYGQRRHTLAEAGKVVGLSASRISGIEHKAMRKLTWVARNIGIWDEAELDRYLVGPHAERVKQEEARRDAALAKKRAPQERRAARIARDEARRAKARLGNWKRKLDAAATEKERLSDEAFDLRAKIERIERRSSLVMFITNGEATLTRLRNREAEIGEALTALANSIAHYEDQAARELATQG